MYRSRVYFDQSEIQERPKTIGYRHLMRVYSTVCLMIYCLSLALVKFRGVFNLETVNVVRE